MTTSMVQMIQAVRREQDDRFAEGWDVLASWPDDSLAAHLEAEGCHSEAAALECALQIATHGLLPMHRQGNYPSAWRV